MFKKIKKIGIVWVLFIALFSLENYAASFTFNNNRYSLGYRGWHSYGKDLTAQVLKNYLQTTGSNCLKELTRLILAQDNPRHNNPYNDNVNYINQQNINDLVNTNTIHDVRRHMFDHGHMGWYPFSWPYDPNDLDIHVHENPRLNPRGIFNIADNVLADVQNNINPRWMRQGNILIRFPQGYNISPLLYNTADNIIKDLFSQNIRNIYQINQIQNLRQNNQIRNLRQNNRFEIDVIYSGPQIHGLTPLDPIGFKRNNQETDQVRIIVKVEDGLIILVSIFPLD